MINSELIFLKSPDPAWSWKKKARRLSTCEFLGAVPSAVLNFLARELRKADLSCFGGNMWPVCYIYLEIHTWGKVCRLRYSGESSCIDVHYKWSKVL